MKETRKVMEEIQATKKMRIGTVEWFTIAGATIKEGENETVAAAPELSGDFFLSRD